MTREHSRGNLPGPDLQAEAAQDAPEAHLSIVKLTLNELAGGQQRTHLLGGKRFAVDRSEPAKPHQLGNAANLGAQTRTASMISAASRSPPAAEMVRPIFPARSL